MSRNVVTQGTPDRSFAGLMDHLTGFSRDGASNPDTEPDFGATFRRTSKPNSTPTDSSLTNPRTGARPMLPVVERKPERIAASRDAAELSYEKALRIHGRRRNPPTALQTPPAGEQQPPNVPDREAGASTAKKVAPNLKATSGNQKSQPSQPRTNLPVAHSDAKQVPQGSRAASPPVTSSASTLPAAVLTSTRTSPGVRTNPGKKSTAPTKLAQSSSGKRKKTKDAAAGVFAKPAKILPDSLPTPLEQSRARQREKSQAKLRSSATTKDAAQLSAEGIVSQEAPRVDFKPDSSGVEVMKPELAGSQLELMHDLGQLDQRRTIVSVRLTEVEFACLRDRAEESGISVSAYMRSCVVDADQLRTQVKRALAEMRSLSLPTGSGQIALAPSSHRSDGPGVVQGWFQLVLRPLTFLFGPLFPSRRSA